MSYRTKQLNNYKQCLETFSRKRSMSEQQYTKNLNSFLRGLEVIKERSTNVMGCINRSQYSNELVKLLTSVKFVLIEFNPNTRRMDNYFDSFLAKLLNTITFKDEYYHLVIMNNGITELQEHLKYCQLHHPFKMNSSSFENIVVKKFYEDLIKFGGVDKIHGIETDVQVKLQQIFCELLS